jgi:hypothetical protein
VRWVTGSPRTPLELPPAFTMSGGITGHSVPLCRRQTFAGTLQVVPAFEKRWDSTVTEQWAASNEGRRGRLEAVGV